MSEVNGFAPNVAYFAPMLPKVHFINITLAINIPFFS